MKVTEPDAIPALADLLTLNGRQAAVLLREVAAVAKALGLQNSAYGCAAFCGKTARLYEA
ncbi:hypothetical protein [Klebsiella pneumoniae]|uniref:hypothetical protein n=1 Tax=Klebsiella pneumoniae TaxID=573 RepID=UPI001585FAC2|nr:hypothetical protein [Klebsiella pneumoniae]